ncbi:S-layer homology domain-containing protein [Alteribacillus persepolensis]|uniref:S-layer homology domain-containing protein n=1 Tax=Alteribacillus persepolensis TaxID=568899 RepID=A0A1G8J2G0_9BACI|nr:S-layer homology domain-containing protein [Alteribacillus persepolensis]SDI25376.1 S-layer homology domain-containing protein [Alteribacillus persepolensis]
MGKSKKLITGAACAFALFLSAHSTEAATYTDISEDFWAKESIDYLADKGVISGYPDGSFQPNRPISRSQAASMLVSALGLDTSERPDGGFTDVSDNHHRYDIINTVNDAGIIRGSNGEFRPAESITRAQMAAVIRRSFDMEESKEEMFTDVAPDYWSFTDISTIAANGIASGYEDGTFRPGNHTTRAQFSVFLENAMKLDSGEERPAPPPSNEDSDVKRGVTVEADGWTYTVDDQYIVRTNEAGEKEYVLTREDMGEDFSYDHISGGSGLTTGSPLMLHDGWIYYQIHVNDDYSMGYANYSLYRVRTDGSKKERIIDQPMKAPYIYDDHIYYVEVARTMSPEESASLKRADLDGSNPETIHTTFMKQENTYFGWNSDVFYALQYGENIIVYSTDDAVYQYSMETGKKERIHGRSANEIEVTSDQMILGTDDGLYAVDRAADKKTKIQNHAVLDMEMLGDSLYILSENTFYQWDLKAEDITMLNENLNVSPAVHNVSVGKHNEQNGYIAFIDENTQQTYVYFIKDGQVIEQDVIEGEEHGVAHTMAENSIYLTLRVEDSNEQENRLLYAFDTGNETIHSISFPLGEKDALRMYAASDDFFFGAPRKVGDSVSVITGDVSHLNVEEWTVPFEESTVSIHSIKEAGGEYYGILSRSVSSGGMERYLVKLNEDEKQFDVIYSTVDTLEFIERDQGGMYVFTDRNDVAQVEIINGDGETIQPPKPVGGRLYGQIEKRGDMVYVYHNHTKINAAYPVSLLEGKQQ